MDVLCRYANIFIVLYGILSKRIVVTQVNIPTGPNFTAVKIGPFPTMLRLNFDRARSVCPPLNSWNVSDKVDIRRLTTKTSALLLLDVIIWVYHMCQTLGESILVHLYFVKSIIYTLKKHLLYQVGTFNITHHTSSHHHRDLGTRNRR